MVAPVGEDNIDVVKAETCQRFLCAFEDTLKRLVSGNQTALKYVLLPGQATIVWTFAKSPEEFGGDHQIGATQSEFTDSTTPTNVVQNKVDRVDPAFTHISISERPAA